VTYTLAVNVENLTLTGSAAINGTGNSLNNVITGNSGNNTLTGDAGNDTLNGGTGTDTLIGGLGNDTYVVDSLSDTITEALNAGTDTVQSSVAYTLGTNVENLTLTGSGAINGTGNSLNNLITGNSGNNSLTGGSGNDTLNGGTGTDTLIGGLGDDTYVTDGSDTITEAANAGTDTVQSSATITLGANVENLTLTGSGAINGTGNTLSNVLTGNSAANSISGGGGNDTIIGGAGNDTLEGAAGNDSLNGGDGIDTASFNGASAAVSVNLSLSSSQNTVGAGTDTLVSIENLIGSALNDTLTGNDSANSLTGGSGNDSLNGGAGNDTLIGGVGNDTFIFNTVAQSGITATASDVITDFVRGQDKINLSAIDAFAGTVANDTFTWKGAADFSSTTQGEVRFQKFNATGTTAAHTMVWIDNDADTAVEMAIRLTGLYDLDASDFIL
jgi:Ca2+-binding RTX toxin-like protein